MAIEFIKRLYNYIVAPAGSYINRNRIENMIQDLYEQDSLIVDKLNEVIERLNNIDKMDDKDIEKLIEDVDKLKQDTSTLQSNVDALSDLLDTLSGNISGKQDLLTAGNNVNIENNVISATDTTYSKVNYTTDGLCTKEQLFALSKLLLNSTDTSIKKLVTTIINPIEEVDILNSQPISFDNNPTINVGDTLIIKRTIVSGFDNNDIEVELDGISICTISFYSQDEVGSERISYYDNTEGQFTLSELYFDNTQIEGVEYKLAIYIVKKSI